jgi:DNA/RNA endonuclease G (NUC1)
MVAGTHVTQIEMRGEEKERSKRRAANDLVISRAQLAQQRNAMAASLSDVLGLPAVQQAMAAVAFAVFTELKNKLPEWTEIDVEQLMSFFGPAMLSVAQA